ncbi:MAG: urease accessory protein UreD [Sulfuricellaceae bacterium]|nr:urease accessory protein UreD [Sulfuricellaceae bacterium]
MSAPPLAAGWQARLQLGFERRGGDTILGRREHFGPLRVQKPLYPEGRAVCHVLLLHPPAGIAGGDELDIEAMVGEGAHALLTTPGAGKWYRSAGLSAAQRLRFDVGRGGALEWLPQETIVFDGAQAGMKTRIALAAEARFIGWDVLCLGRRASGERFESGSIRLETRVEREGRPLWLERGRLEGGSPLLESPAGLAGHSVSATLLAVGPVDAALLAACREILPTEAGARHGITVLPEVLLARYLGHSSEAARAWLTALWRLLRPALLGREVQTPRIWNT